MNDKNVNSISGLDDALLNANLESIHIPFGVGICGHVAQTKREIILKNPKEVLPI